MRNADRTDLYKVSLYGVPAADRESRRLAAASDSIIIVSTKGVGHDELFRSRTACVCGEGCGLRVLKMSSGIRGSSEIAGEAYRGGAVR